MCNTHNTKTQVEKKTSTPWSTPTRRLLAASILKVSAIAVCREIDIDLRNTAMQFLDVKLTFALFYWLLFCMPLTDAHGDKRYVFLVNTCAFYLAVASNQRALTPAIRRYIFCRDPPSPRRVRGMVSDEGGGAPSPPWCTIEREVGSSVLFLLIV